MSSVAKLEALLSRVQANRAKPRGAAPMAFKAAAPAPARIEEDDDEPMITTDVIDPASDADMLQVVTEEFEEARTGETDIVPPTPVPAARTTPPSVPPPPVSFRPGSPSPVTTGSQAGLLPQAPVPQAATPLAAERIATPSIVPPSSPIARAISEARVSPMPTTFGKLISRSLSLRPR